MDDADLLLDWVNQPDSLAQKLKTTDAIDPDDHYAWLARALESDQYRLCILKDRDKPIGQVRLQQVEQMRWVVDIFIIAPCRGNGAAQYAIRSAAHTLAQFEPQAILQADVKSGNLSSTKLFQRLGFKLEKSHSDYSTFVARIEDLI